MIDLLSNFKVYELDGSFLSEVDYSPLKSSLINLKLNAHDVGKQIKLFPQMTRLKDITLVTGKYILPQEYNKKYE